MRNHRPKTRAEQPSGGVLTVDRGTMTTTHCDGLSGVFQDRGFSSPLRNRLIPPGFGIMARGASGRIAHAERKHCHLECDQAFGCGNPNHTRSACRGAGHRVDTMKASRPVVTTTEAFRPRPATPTGYTPLSGGRSCRQILQEGPANAAVLYRLGTAYEALRNMPRAGRSILLLPYVGEQGHESGPLDGQGHGMLANGRAAGLAAANYLPLTVGQPLEQPTSL